MLQELKKDYSMENALLAGAKEKAMSKTTWVDEIIEEKNRRQRMPSKGATEKRPKWLVYTLAMLANERHSGALKS